LRPSGKSIESVSRTGRGTDSSRKTASLSFPYFSDAARLRSRKTTAGNPSTLVRTATRVPFISCTVLDWDSIRPEPPAQKYRRLFSSRHFANIDRASSTEMAFIFLMQEHGVDYALYHAARNGWSYERPLRALVASWKDLPSGGDTDMKKKEENTRSDEYATFENALKTILSVPRSEIQSKLHAPKRKKKPSSRASTSER
jgi:hypothetical protein